MNEALIAVGCFAAVTAARFAGKQFAKRVIHPVTKDMKADIARMVAEFNPNGGSSLRDRVDSIALRADAAAAAAERAVAEAQKVAAAQAEFIAYEHKRWHDLGGFLQAEMGAKYRESIPDLFKPYQDTPTD